MRAVVILLVVALAACHTRPAPHAVTPAIQKLVAGNALPKVESAVWTDVRAFYTQRENAPAWVDARRPTDNAIKVIALLKTAPQHGFDPADYDAAALEQLGQSVEQIDKESPERLGKLAQFDTQLTASLLKFGRDVAVGRQHGDAHFKARRESPDLVAAVSAAVDDPETFVDAVRPPHPEYAALQKALDDLLGQKAKGGWVKVPSASSPELRQRLTVAGYLKPAAGSREPGAGNLAEAVKSFQELHSIPATGKVDAATLDALNVPLDWRIQQVAINMQRWRWMPDDLGERHFIVNIPYYHLIARESGKPVMDIRVVVGKPGHNTPIFSEDMETVVFSPYWNIPDTIAENETAPAVARDPDYLKRQGIEILRVSGSSTQTLDPADVDWDNPEALKGLAFRQRPGASNALGHVKFLFPNPYNVYLHDTPADALFAKPGRAFSHGCIRVEEPETLAKYVLKGYSEWPDEKIFEAMRSGNEQYVKLKEKIPVHIVYFTAWVDENGGLHFQPDIYGYDRDGGN